MHSHSQGAWSFVGGLDTLGAEEVSISTMKQPPRLVAGTGVHDRRSGQSGDYKLHIVMDRESIAKLRWLRANLEASTDAEVIRRALKAYEIIQPADEDHGSPHLDGPRHLDQNEGPNLSMAGAVEHLYIRIPTRMKARLDIEYDKSGRTYGEQVRQALRVLMQLARNLDALKEGIRAEGRDVNDSRSHPPASSETEPADFLLAAALVS
jgi:hypothetical protein